MQYGALHHVGTLRSLLFHLEMAVRPFVVYIRCPKKFAT
jgi:hypothetical protein